MSIPRDYAGEPQYPEPWTTNKPREGLRDIDEARIVSLAPDVCWTPLGSSVVPIPYPVVDFCGHDKNYTPSVRFTRKKAMVMRSCTTHVHGDKPGIRKGRKSGTVESICEPIGHADQVRAEGSHVIRHLDRFYMNSKNTQGEAIFVRSTQTFDPPKENDPIRGSLRAQTKPIEVALDTSSPEGRRLLRELMRDNPAKPSSLPKIPTPPPSGTSTILQRLGIFGRVLGSVAAPMALITSGGTPDLDTAILADNAASRALEGISPLGTEEKALYDATKQRISTHIYDAYNDPFSSPDENYIEQERKYLEQHLKIDRSRRLATALKEGVRIDTSNKDEWPCVVGPYKYVKMVCPGEAHHIIPDMVYRIGNAPTNEVEKNSKAGRIKNSPTYNEGQAICLTTGMHRTDDDAVHKSLNPALSALGLRYTPQGTAPLGEIRGEVNKAIDRVPELPEKCKRMAKLAAMAQVGQNEEQPGRTTIRPPQLPGGKDVIDGLQAGSY